MLDALSGVPAADWDALHDGSNPFVRHAFLEGLERHGCVQPACGWTPRHLTLWDGARLAGAAPAYLKRNSHGEFVFDHAWARAYAQHGLDYFPKWLCAVPYSPVTGPRLLVSQGRDPRVLAEAFAGAAGDAGLSSAHVNFHDAATDAAFDEVWLERLDVQYHWENRAGWRDFGDFLDGFDHRRRKNIRQERARLAREGVTARIVEGRDASEADLATMHGFYLRTFHEYGNHPALTLPFFRHLAAAMPESLVIVFAERAGRAIAGALCLRGGRTLYGRYWGASEAV
ncbi:MAG TPA: GNAT family N-acetyltransferase, partial [Lysobacter sp.]